MKAAYADTGLNKRRLPALPFIDDCFAPLQAQLFCVPLSFNPVLQSVPDSGYHIVTLIHKMRIKIKKLDI